MVKQKKVCMCVVCSFFPFKCLHFYDTFGLMFCLSSGVRGKEALYLKVCFLPDRKGKREKKHGTLCTNTVRVARVPALVLQKQSGSGFTVLSVKFIYFFSYVSEAYNRGADALCSSTTPHFQLSVWLCCRFVVGCTGLTCLEQAGCLSVFR